jgi:hypothetical protein
MLKLVPGLPSMSADDRPIKVRSADPPTLNPALARALYVAFEQLSHSRSDNESRTAA